MPASAALYQAAAAGKRFCYPLALALQLICADLISMILHQAAPAVTALRRQRTRDRNNAA
jgi:hypothetical protein